MPLLPENWAPLPQRSGRKALMKMTKQSLKISWKMRTRELPTSHCSLWDKEQKNKAKTTVVPPENSTERKKIHQRPDTEFKAQCTYSARPGSDNSPTSPLCTIFSEQGSGIAILLGKSWWPHLGTLLIAEIPNTFLLTRSWRKGLGLGRKTCTVWVLWRVWQDPDFFWTSICTYV